MQRADGARRRKGRWVAALLFVSLLLALPLFARPAAAQGETGLTWMIKVGVGRSLDYAGIAAEGDLAILDGAGNLLATAPAGATAGVALAGAADGGPGIWLTLPGDATPRGPFASPLRLVPAAPAAGKTNYVLFKQRRYRGQFVVLINRVDGKLSVVNELPVEDYLRGVVTKEMYPGWPLDALKAQAVASRTYALQQQASGRWSQHGFDLTDDTFSQVYFGVTGETAAGDKAVAETAGQVMTSGGSLISSFYHSTAGGHTEDSEVVWSAALPYLRGVPSPDEAYQDWFSWTVQRTPAQIAEALRNRSTPIDIGEVLNITPSGKQGSGGRWSHWLFTGSRGEVRLSGETVRGLLGVGSGPRSITATQARTVPQQRQYAAADTVQVIGAGGTARSLRLDQAVVLGGGAAAAQPLPAGAPVVAAGAPVTRADGFTVSGGGLGHGVGMSQWGARGMALQGKTYREILTHYYTGVQITTLGTR